MKGKSQLRQNNELAATSEVALNVSGQAMLRDYPAVTDELLATAAQAAIEVTSRVAETAQKLLMQLEYWLNRTSLGREAEGQKWLRLPLWQIKEWAFRLVSISTLSRAMNFLEALGLIKVENLNRTKYDQTRWYTLNPEGLRQLSTLEVLVAAPANVESAAEVIEQTVERDPRLAAYAAEQQAKPAQTAKTLGQTQEKAFPWLFNRVLAEMCKVDYTVPRQQKRVDEVADTLKFKGHTVQTLQWFTRWWYEVCWVTRKPGKQNEVPSLGNVLSMIDQATEYALKQGWGDTR